jgi:hypothetical protein
LFCLFFIFLVLFVFRFFFSIFIFIWFIYLFILKFLFFILHTFRYLFLVFLVPFSDGSAVHLQSRAFEFPIASSANVFTSDTWLLTLDFRGWGSK